MTNRHTARVENEPATDAFYAVAYRERSHTGAVRYVRGKSAGIDSTITPREARMFKTKAGASKWIADRSAGLPAQFAGFDVVILYAITGTVVVQERRPFAPGHKLGTKRDDEGNPVRRAIVVDAFATPAERIIAVANRKVIRAAGEARRAATGGQ